MSAHRQLVQELLALAICGGSHQLVLSVGDDRWSLPVVDGRVGPLAGASNERLHDQELAEELAMISAVDGVIIRRERLKGGRAQLRWLSASALAKTLEDQTEASRREVLEFEQKAPDMIQTMDILDRLSAELVKAGTAAEVIDQCVVACRALFPSAIMLHWDGQGSWLGPQGALIGATERLTDAVERGTLDIFTPCGEAYEDLLGRPPLVVLVPMSGRIVTAIAWADDGVQSRPVAALLVQRMCRIALRHYEQSVEAGL